MTALTVRYSQDADVLYLTFSDQRSGISYIEKDTGDILRIDVATGKIVGVTIQLFMYRLSHGEKIDIPEIGDIPVNSVLRELLRARLVKAS